MAISRHSVCIDLNGKALHQMFVNKRAHVLIRVLNTRQLIHTSAMSKSKYEYVRQYEESSDTTLLRDCYIVVRIDGQKFHKFSKTHHLLKPNDKRFVLLCPTVVISSADSLLTTNCPLI